MDIPLSVTPTVYDVLYKKAFDIYQAWIDDLNENGFTSKEGIDRGFPKQFTTLSELIDLTAKIIYTCTVRHAATHCEAMDMYGHEGIVPACMKMPPPTKEGEGKKDLTVKTLPDQNPDQYCITMSYVMAQYKADMVGIQQQLNETLYKHIVLFYPSFLQLSFFF